MSWTPHHYYDLVYLNGFVAIDQFTGPARAPAAGGPLGQTGLLFAASGLGRFGAAVPARTNDMAGASLGYQWFFDESRRQIVWEIAGAKEIAGPTSRGVIGSGLVYQQAIGQHFIWIASAAVSKIEANNNVLTGARTELRMKF